MKRRILSVLTALALCLSLCPVTALAAEGGDITGTSLHWELDETGTLTITGTGDMPAMGSEGNIENNLVRPWEKIKSNIQKVVIEDGVTSIGKNAFADCSNLTEVIIGGSLESIGESAFFGCSGITAMQIPETVTSIGGWAFYACTNLASINLPSQVTTIEDGTFQRCYVLKTLSIPSGVKEIGASAFSDCVALTSVALPNILETIGVGAFSGCEALTSATLPNSITSIGWGAFEGCIKLESMAIPTGVKKLDESTFAGCTALKSVAIPEGVETIGESAFSGCSVLTSMEIPASVTNIGNSAFQKTGLTSVTFKGTTPPTLGSNVFDGSSPTIYIPQNASGYKDDWKDLGVTLSCSGNSHTYGADGVCTNCGVIKTEGPPAGVLDFSNNDAPRGNLETDGYMWGKSGDKIYTLTLRADANFEKVTLPGDGAQVTIVANGASTITELNYNGLSSATSIQLTLKGGPLNIKNEINFSGGADSVFEVAANAEVVVGKRLSVGQSGGTKGTITVNGSLTVSGGDSSPASISTGKIEVKSGGRLTVTGTSANITANGMGNDGAPGNFTDAFAIGSGGSFAYTSSGTFKISVNGGTQDFPSDTDVKKIINIPDGYLPAGVDRRLEGSEIFIEGNGPFEIKDNSSSSGSGGSGGQTTPPTPPTPTYYRITVTSSEGGKATASRTAAPSGSTITLTATPEDGWFFKEWVVVRGGVTITEQNTFRMPSREVEIRAEFEPIPHAHIWSVEWSTDGENHWHICTAEGCDLTDASQMDSYGAHVYDDDADAVCNICGYERVVEHKHAWSEAWSSDGSHHWHICTAEGCDLTDASQMDGYGEHIYDSDTDAVCNTCGYQRAIKHEHTWSTSWRSDSTHHWHVCTEADCPLTGSEHMGGYGEHVYDDNTDMYCNVCGYQRTPAASRPTSHSSGGRGIVTYPITIDKSARGTVISNRTSAASGSTVTLTVTNSTHTLIVTDSQGNEIELTAKGGDQYTFTMPSRAVTVKSALADDTGKPCNGGADCPSRSFIDLGTVGTWYHEAVDFALRNGLMNGYSSAYFGPNDRVTRSQLAQILYAKEGRPAVSGESGFTDVPEGKGYTPAITWAAANGIINGYGSGLFGPDDNVTREQLATALWRYAGSPAATEQELHFADMDKVSRYALEALRWAVKNGILNGYGDGRLNPEGLATRAQMAQILKNFMENS